MCAALGLAAALLSVQAAAKPVVATTAGKVQGRVEDGIAVFRGLPFAAPPVGSLRWRAPQPVRSWQSIRPADHFSQDCIQAPQKPPSPSFTNVSEDCLYLNLWTPAAHGAPLPVIVWIYGGGFVQGGASNPVFDGATFARDGFVAVTLNYRLGQLGFFAHPALTAANEGPVGNYGLLDQLAALQWVHANVARFGGDPSRVLIVGESAGGISVTALMSSPMARGLFSRAVVMSGAGRGLLGGMPLRDAEAIGTNVAHRLGVDGSDAAALRALRDLPAGDFMGKGDEAAFSGPIIDGRFLTEPIPQTFARHRLARVPLIVGATSADLSQFPQTDKAGAFASFGPNAAEAARAYDPDGSRAPKAVTDLIGRDATMIEPARFLAQSTVGTGQKAWLYRFSYVAPALRAGTPAGARHASDVPYLFVTNDRKYAAVPEDLAVARLFHHYVEALAKSGDPNMAGQARWTAYAPGSDQVMDFGADGTAHMVTDPLKARLDLIQRRAERVAPAGSE